MVVMHFWEIHINKVVMKLLDILDAEEYGEDSLSKIEYSLRVIVGESEKMMLLCVLFGVAGYLMDLMIAFGTIIMLRIFTGGIHRKTLLGCFFQTLFNLSLIVFLEKFIMFDNDVYVFIVAILVFLVLYFVPIQSENRIHYNEKQRLEFKVKALTAVIVILLLGGYLPKAQHNIVMFAVLAHTLELAFLCVRIRKKEVNQNGVWFKAEN